MLEIFMTILKYPDVWYIAWLSLLNTNLTRFIQ